MQQQSQVGVELYINDDKELFRSLYERKAEIEADVGAELDWRELPEKKASRILIKRNTNLTDEQECPQQLLQQAVQEEEKRRQEEAAWIAAERKRREEDMLAALLREQEQQRREAKGLL